MMNDNPTKNTPSAIAGIEIDTKHSGFTMPSERKTGSLLRTLAATKPGGRFLELGTGTGLSTCWILDGMNSNAHLISVDSDEKVIAIARKHLGTDTRVEFVCKDGAKFLTTIVGQRFDFIFADTWPGKFTHLDEALCLLAPSGLYVIDDLLPQPNWREGHAPKVPILIEALEMRQELFVTKLNWDTGLVVATRKAKPGVSH